MVRTTYKQVVSDDEDVRELNPHTAQQQSAFSGRPSFNIPESSRKDGSGFFIPGITLPPLGEGMLQNARETRTSGVANEFGYHIAPFT